MHQVLKVNGAEVFSVEMLRKLHGWHVRRRRVLVHCVGGRLEKLSGKSDKYQNDNQRCFEVNLTRL